MRILSAFLLCLSLATTAFSGCDFNHALYIDKLREPGYVKQIEINVPKSAKFNRNFAKILTNKSNYIPEKLKKKFDAQVEVKYLFGSCSYLANVRQNGDLKDHLIFANGKPVRSLKVTLKSGNIIGAVKFKLLVPETRNGKKEILGSLVLKELGFIAPETFAVNTTVNNVSSVMLFQEDSQKELLERNLRREGPILEGDEVPLWDGGFRAERQSLALSRVQNDNWLEKGESSLQIGMKAFLSLQAVYLSYFFDDGEKSRDIFSQLMPTQQLNDFYFLMIAMNGLHALSPNNRKFYYNSFDNTFEPIYYDGNFDFRNMQKFDGRDVGHFDKDYVFDKADLLMSEIFMNKLKKSYISRAESMTAHEHEFDQMLKIINENIFALQERIKSGSDKVKISSTLKIDDLVDRYRQQAINQNYSQKHILSHVDELGKYVLVKDNSITEVLDASELINLISNNLVGKDRTILLPKNMLLEKVDRGLQVLGMHITASSGILLDVDEVEKTLDIEALTANDWVLIKNMNLSGWRVVFSYNGKATNGEPGNAQRFNQFGLTGCLNFYNVEFDETWVESNNAGCEDGVNIVNSVGSISNVKVFNAKSDALDMDFSEIEIQHALIHSAGNDCLDVSTGLYNVHVADLHDCGDKGISVGEASKFVASEVSITNASIGISSKDLSEVELSQAVVKNVDICVEAFQKKQEFGGAYAKVDNLDCLGKIVSDEYSLVVQNEF